MRRMAKHKPTAVEQEFARLAKTLARLDAPETESRRARGLRTLTANVGVRGGRVLTELVKFSPELTRFIVDFAYGDVIGRNRLDARTRALVVVAALAARGDALPELRTHFGTALNCGCTREEILEVLLVIAVYAGFPAALNGMAAAREVFGEREKKAKGGSAARRRRAKKAGG